MRGGPSRSLGRSGAPGMPRRPRPPLRSRRYRAIQRTSDDVVGVGADSTAVPAYMGPKNVTAASAQPCRSSPKAASGIRTCPWSRRPCRPPPRRTFAGGALSRPLMMASMIRAGGSSLDDPCPHSDGRMMQCRKSSWRSRRWWTPCSELRCRWSGPSSWSRLSLLRFLARWLVGSFVANPHMQLASKNRRSNPAGTSSFHE